MTTILKQMGIQQWRLRKAKAGVAPTIENNIEADAKINVEAQIEPNISTNAVLENQYQAQSNNIAVPVEPSDDQFDGLSHDQSNKEVAGQGVAESIDSPAPVPVAMPLEPNGSGEELKTPAHPIESLDWQGLQANIDRQNQCLSCGPSNSILGAGDTSADWLFVSDAPSRLDLEQYQLFSGRAGQLYEAMLNALGLDRDSVYTTSIFKCVASDDLSIAASCDKLIYRQIDLLKPKVIVTFGEFATQSVAKSNENLEQLRKQNLRCHHSKVPIVATYNPLLLLEEPLLKAGAWADLKRCASIVG